MGQRQYCRRICVACSEVQDSERRNLFFGKRRFFVDFEEENPSLGNGEQVYDLEENER